MSKVYEFKAMSQVETLEGPTETTTVLAVEDGAVKQIPVSAVGGGSFVVHLEMDPDTGALTADKTYAEVVAALESGAVPFALVVDQGGFLLAPLTALQDSILLFAIISPTAPFIILCTPDNSWTLYGENEVNAYDS